MIWELLGAVVLGVVAGGMAWGLRRVTGSRLPKWVTPAAAGIGMLTYGVWMDYTWGARTEAALPAGVEAVREARDGSFLRPWTLLAPPVMRIAAVNAAGALTNEAAPDMRLARMYLFERNMPPGEVGVLVDCAAARMAVTTGAVGFDAAGAPQVQGWEALSAGDPMLTALCDGRASG